MSIEAASWLKGSSSSDVSLDGVGPKCTLMKNFSEVRSENCWRSRMLRLCWAKMPVTAWTMPGLSGQESVRMWSLIILGSLMELGGFVDRRWWEREFVM